MELRPDTSSGRFRGQWSFLHNPPPDTQPRSLPPSSYVRSDQSSISPLQAGHYRTISGSRSSLSRNLPSASTGARSTTTIPSQPVLLRIHSADASAHVQPTPRLSRRPIKTSKQNGLPVIEEYSIEGILNAIQEDVEADINNIAEILGRSRLVLADQHDSQMPPQGEIRANISSLQAVEEVSASSERLAADNILILRDDASLVEGSNSGSAAYGLLERLQALPRVDRVNGEHSPMRSEHSDQEPQPHHSSPGPSSQTGTDCLHAHGTRSHVTPTDQDTTAVSVANRGPSQAVVSETYLSAEASISGHDSASTVSQSGRHYALHDENSSELLQPYESINHDREGLQSTPRRRFQNIFPADLSGMTSWFSTRSSTETAQSAEAQLRGLLNR